MSANRKQGYRPQLEGLEDRCTPSTLHVVPHHILAKPAHPATHHTAPKPAHAAHNNQPPVVFNPFQTSTTGIPFGHTFAPFAKVSQPSDGGFFPQGLGTNFYPPSIFHF